MANDRKRERLLRYLPFRWSTSQQPGSRVTPPQITTAVGSRTLVFNCLIGFNLAAKIEFPPRYQHNILQHRPYLHATCPMDTNTAVQIGSDLLRRSGLMTTTIARNDRARNKGGKEEQTTRTVRHVITCPPGE